MAHIKLVSPSGWDFNEPSAVMVKISSRGLIGHDRSEFIKRAGDASSVFLPRLNEIKIAADEVPVHVISHGASEMWSANRNGDAFSEKACRDYKHTFEKFARAFRNHKNKDTSISYGFPKLAAYNNGMHRVELLVLLNATKSAADRNGGLVADKEIEKLSRDDNLPVSMACRVPFDRCSFCGNEAKTREDYCTGEKCAAGGCKDHLTHLVKIGNDVHHLHVDNPHPVWFDISHVFRPADRTAYGSRADYLTKAASDLGFFGEGGSKTAEDMGVTAPLGVIIYQDALLPGDWPDYIADQIKIAHALDAMEHQDQMLGETGRAFSSDMQPPIDFDAFRADDREKVAGALGALADNRIVLSLRDFAVLTKRASLADTAAKHVVGVYGRMIADGSLERRLVGNEYLALEKKASLRQRHQAALLHSTYSLDPEAVRDRCMLSVLRQQPAPNYKPAFEKQAAHAPEIEELVRDYACYKAAALRRISEFDNDFLLTARLSATQNRVI